MIRFSNLRVEINQELTTELVAELVLCNPSQIKEWHIYKKSIDARKKRDIHYNYAIDVEFLEESKIKLSKNAERVVEKEYKFPKVPPMKTRPVIVGSGPAGLFAGIVLAENGHRPIIIERGECVEKRMESVLSFQRTGVLNTESNVQFGEGGAGTFSDGKLTTGIKNIRCKKVLEYFVKFGAPEEIIYSSKPHIGTDLLCEIVKNMREYIKSLGGEVRFESRVERLVVKNSRVTGVIVNGEELLCDNVILAIGHSARDTIRTLYQMGVDMLQKAFSVGARIEHSQEMINDAQYGDKKSLLGAADYKLSAHLENGRGVYTFCMCPGGVVVGAASYEGGVVTNGMSYYKRDGKNSNSALLVGVNPSDFEDKNPMSAIKFQEKIERAAYIEGGKNYYAPTQRVGDFLKDIASTGEGQLKPTYLPGIKWGKIDCCLPKFVCDSMREAILIFDKKLKGFKDKDAILTAPETRSSSPVRIIRGEDCQANIGGLYPCGEGAGYAGGIMSAAVDGIVCAENMVLNNA